MHTPVNPSFTILKWGVRGCPFHGHVRMIQGPEEGNDAMRTYSIKADGLAMLQKCLTSHFQRTFSIENFRKETPSR